MASHRHVAARLLTSRSAISSYSSKHINKFSTTRSRILDRPCLHKPVTQLSKGNSVRLQRQLRCASVVASTSPDAKSYIESGAISEPQNLVDVKKVLVIGSGGLSIGQAGEFDYSGETGYTYWSREKC